MSYDKRGRGIAVFVREEINTTVLHLNMDIEAVGDDILINPVLLETKPSKLALIHIYVRPGTSNWKRHQFFDSLLSEVKNFDYLICGDLNDPSKTFSRYNQNPRSPIADLISDHYITIANDGSITYPRANSCLDISLTSFGVEAFSKVIQDLSSDHYPCILNVLSHCIESKAESEEVSIKFTNWKKARKYVNRFCREVDEAMSLDLICETFITNVSTALKVSKTTQKQRKSVFWWNEELTRLKRARNAARRQKNWTEHARIRKCFRKEFQRLKKNIDPN